MPKSHTNPFGRRYAINCDECKKTIGFTNDQGESIMGGKCKQCKKQIKAGNWNYFD